MSKQDPSIAAALRAFESQLLTRQKALEHALQTHDWAAIPAIVNDPRKSLQSLTQTIAQGAEALEKAADDAQRQVLQTQFAELEARMKLVPRKQAVLDAIAKLQLEAALKECQQELRASGGRLAAASSVRFRPAASGCCSDVERSRASALPGGIRGLR